ncbi:MAG: hypothetical protein CVT48_05390 [Thermoplasmata archaeon HGW-Thermoplasmata-1]|nr:MAG: hypothetical protein CVT48_05390 [Thermoplasmata archaeon HGW-Thermoplasmata-1]
MSNQKFVKASALVALMLVMAGVTAGMPVARAEEKPLAEIIVWDFLQNGTVVQTIQHWKESEISTETRNRAQAITGTSDLIDTVGLVTAAAGSHNAAFVDWSGTALGAPVTAGAIGVYAWVHALLKPGDVYVDPLVFGAYHYSSGKLLLSFSIVGFLGSCSYNPISKSFSGSGFAAHCECASVSNLDYALEIIPPISPPSLDDIIRGDVSPAPQVVV